MVDAVKELGTPSLRATWVAAKKKAEDEAKKLKLDAKFDALDKKFKKDFGPDLEAWPKLYPDYKKLETEQAALLVTLKAYQDAIKAAALDAKVAKPMNDALAEIKDELGKRLKKAELLVMSDEKLALKESKKKQAAPIIVFNQDIAAQVKAKSGDAAKVLKVDSILLQAVLADNDVLEKVPNDLDDAVLAKEIREAANFDKVVGEVAKALVDAADKVRADPKAFDAAEKAFETAVGQAVADALGRAAVPILKYTKVKTGVRNYKIKTGIQVSLTALGALASVASLSLAPLSFGVTTVATALALAKSGVVLGKQIAEISAKAEEVAVWLAKDIATLGSQYENAKKTAVGVAELGKTLVNATLPTLVTTISSAKGNADLLGTKIDELKIKTHEKAGKLGELLTEQSKVQAKLREFERSGKDAFSDAEAKALQKLIGVLDRSAESVQALIDKVEALHDRVGTTSTEHARLQKALDGIASKEPTWAQVGEVVINVAAGVGFMVAGNVNAPSAYAFAKVAADVNTVAGNLVVSIDTAKGGLEGLMGVLEKKKG